MKMFTTIERLPNEILLGILSYLSWFDVLTSFWSLNIRLNSLVCLTLSRNDNRLISTHGLSYQKCHSIIYSSIFNSSFLCSSIQNIHFDCSNSTSSDLCYRWLFDDQNILRFPNLKSLDFTRCGSVEPVIRSLMYLVEHQLDELTLTFDQYVFRRFHHLALHFLQTSGITSMNVVESQEGNSNCMIDEICETSFSDSF